MKKRLLFACFILLTLSSHAQAPIDWKQDIDYLKTLLPIRHKNLFFKLPEAQFNVELDRISQLAPTSSDLETQLRIAQLLARVGDAHTGLNMLSVLYRKKTPQLPVQLYWFNDGLFITRTSKENEALLGQKITHFNGFPIDRVIDSLCTLFVAENSSLRKQKGPGLMPMLELERFFGFAVSDTVQLSLESPEGQKQVVALAASTESLDRDKWSAYTPAQEPVSWQLRQQLFKATLLPESNGTYYVAYNFCTGREVLKKRGKTPKTDLERVPSFKEFEKEVLKMLDRGDVHKLIVDLRWNGGGSSAQGTEFARKIAKNKKINRKGAIFVITGRNTFSSAIINTLDFQEKTAAVLVGEPTGGKPNHYGEVRSFTLPSSKLELYYSTKYFQRIPGDPATIQPDQVVEMSFSDYQKGNDPAIQWILNYR